MTPRTQTYRITSASEVIDKPALEGLFREYCAVVLGKLVAAGGPRKAPEPMAAAIMANLDKILPPDGRLMLAHDPEGKLVGCGTLNTIGADAGELKRLFVRREAGGHGLGRKLVDARIEAAREMGLKTLLVNAVVGNSDMLRIYEKIGFRFIERYEGCYDPIELSEYFIYMRYDLE